MASMPTVDPTAQVLGRVESAPSGYMVGPWFDGLLIIGSPLVALLLGVGVSVRLPETAGVLSGDALSQLARRFIIVFTAAHLFLVFFRSHGNRNIYRLYPARFTLVPLALFTAVALSHPIYLAVAVLGIWWDVYHSAAQTFGIGRIYDMKAGNDANLGRRLDWWLNLLIYIGPIVGGVTLFDHLEMRESQDLLALTGNAFFTAIPAYAESYQRILTWGLVAIGAPFLTYYVAAYVGFARRGYRVSSQKVVLLVSTAIVSIWSWGFNTFGEAFFIVNFFHALQYFAIVWWSEKKNMCSRFGLDSRPNAFGRTLAIYVSIAFAYGLVALCNRVWDVAILTQAFLVVSIMHFWYDGFIWSVRKKQVPA